MGDGSRIGGNPFRPDDDTGSESSLRDRGIRGGWGDRSGGRAAESGRTHRRGSGDRSAKTGENDPRNHDSVKGSGRSCHPHSRSDATRQIHCPRRVREGRFPVEARSGRGLRHPPRGCARSGAASMRCRRGWCERDPFFRSPCSLAGGLRSRRSGHADSPPGPVPGESGVPWWDKSGPRSEGLAHGWSWRNGSGWQVHSPGHNTRGTCDSVSRAAFADRRRTLPRCRPVRRVRIDAGPSDWGEALARRERREGEEVKGGD